MSLEELKNKINNGDYNCKLEEPEKPLGYDTERYIYDENRTAVWNKTRRTRLIKQYNKAFERYIEEVELLERELYDEIIKTVKEETGLTLLQAQVTVNTACEKYYSKGTLKIIDISMYLANFALDILSI